MKFIQRKTVGLLIDKDQYIVSEVNGFSVFFCYFCLFDLFLFCLVFLREVLVYPSLVLELMIHLAYDLSSRLRL